MRFLKSLLRGLLSLIFKVSLILLIVIGPAIMVFGTSNQLKKSLGTSGVYDQVVPSIVDNAAKDSDKQQSPGSQDDSPFAQEAVKQAAKTVLTPVFVRDTSEKIIDGLYGWLQGKTAQPEFNIDVSGVKQQFTDAVADYAVARAQKLPACTLQQSRDLAKDSIDPLNVPCLAAGFDIESLRGQVANQLNKQDGDQANLLQQTAITPDTLPKNDEGKTPVQEFSDKASKAPDIFHWLNVAPLILGGLAVVSGGCILLLHDDKRRGLRQLAITLTGLGIVTLFGVLVTNALFNTLQEANGPLANVDANIKGPLTSLMQSLSSAVNQRLLWFGIGYAMLGIGTLITLYAAKPKGPKNTEGAVSTAEETPADDSTPPAAESTETTSTETTQPVKSKPPRNKLIQ